MKIGVIGLGHMGRHYAENLLEAGHEIVVYDTIREAMREIVRLGAKAANSPKEVAQASDIIITALPSPAVEEKVVLGENGILAGAKKGAIIISMGTVQPSTTIKLAKVAKEKGMEYLDAPVSGGEAGAASATLTIMVGGAKNIFEKTKKVLQALGKNVRYAGPQGSGNIAKLINNLLSLTNLVTLSEGMVLGTKAGADPKALYEIIKTSTGRSQPLEFKLPKRIAIGDFEPGFRINLALKDLGLVMEMAKEYSVPLFMTSVAHQMYQLARTKELGEKDITAVIRLLEEATGTTVRFKA